MYFTYALAMGGPSHSIAPQSCGSAAVRQFLASSQVFLAPSSSESHQQGFHFPGITVLIFLRLHRSQIAQISRDSNNQNRGAPGKLAQVFPRDPTVLIYTDFKGFQ